GVLEVADGLVVNKADRQGVDETVRALALALSLGTDIAGAWRPPIVRTTATKGEGIAELVAAIDKHREWARTSGQAERRETDAARAELETLLRESLFRGLLGRVGPARLEDA